MNPRGQYLHPQLAVVSGIWKEIQTSTIPADRWLGNYFHKHRRRYGSHDRRFYSEVIYALLRHRLFIETWAQFFESRESMLMAILAAAAESLIQDDEILEALSVNCPWLNMKPGFLEKIKKHELPPGFEKRVHSPEEELSLIYSFPLWLVRKWIRQFGLEKAKMLFQSSQARPPFSIRANPLKISRDKLLEHFLSQGRKVSAAPYSRFGILFENRVNLFDSEEFREGLFEVQDQGSQMICQWIDPKPGETVWDVCAGGGGKSLLLAAMMQNKGRLIATDIREYKLDELKKRAKRAGVMNIFPADLERMGESREVKKGIDRIVVDAPCSGTGTLRRNPDAKWKLTEETFEINHQDQVTIIEKSLPYLKQGGRLYYITCSLEPEENEFVIKEILQKWPGLKRVPVPDFPEGEIRLFPHVHGTDGFFLAILEK